MDGDEQMLGIMVVQLRFGSSPEFVCLVVRCAIAFRSGSTKEDGSPLPSSPPHRPNWGEGRCDGEDGRGLPAPALKVVII